jgi:hypothetical protein
LILIFFFCGCLKIHNARNVDEAFRLIKPSTPLEQRPATPQAKSQSRRWAASDKGMPAPLGAMTKARCEVQLRLEVRAGQAQISRR